MHVYTLLGLSFFRDNARENDRLGLLIPARQATQERIVFIPLSSLTEDRELPLLVLSEDNISSCTKIRNQLDLIVKLGMHSCKGAGEKQIG